MATRITRHRDRDVRSWRHGSPGIATEMSAHGDPDHSASRPPCSLRAAKHRCRLAMTFCSFTLWRSGVEAPRLHRQSPLGHAELTSQLAHAHPKEHLIVALRLEEGAGRAGCSPRSKRSTRRDEQSESRDSHDNDSDVESQATKAASQLPCGNLGLTDQVGPESGYHMVQIVKPQSPSAAAGARRAERRAEEGHLDPLRFVGGRGETVLGEIRVASIDRRDGRGEGVPRHGRRRGHRTATNRVVRAVGQANRFKATRASDCHPPPRGRRLNRVDAGPSRPVRTPCVPTRAAP
jgi:hypothetical protein